MLSPLDVTPPLSNALRYSSATDLRCSSVIVPLANVMSSPPLLLRAAWVHAGAACPPARPRTPPASATSFVITRRLSSEERTSSRREPAQVVGDVVRDELLVLAGEEEQRALLPPIQVLDVPDVERVIAGGVDVDHPRGHVRNAPLDQRRVSVPDELKTQPIDRPAGEVAADCLLLLG